MMMRMNNTVLSRFELETSNDEPQFEWHFRGQLGSCISIRDKLCK